MGVQKLTSELILKLSQQVSGPAGEARKALTGVEQALAAIGKRKEAEQRLNALSASYEKQKARLKDLTSQIIAAEKPTKALMTSHLAAEKALDQTARKITEQRAAFEAAENGMRNYVSATENMASAESRLKTQAEQAGAALVRAAEQEAQAARMRHSLIKEMERSANEAALINQRAVEAARRAEAEKTAAVAREAAKRQELLRKEAEREAELARISAEKQATIAKKAAEQQTAAINRAREERAAAIDAALGAGAMIVGAKVGDAGRSMFTGSADREAMLNRIRNVSGGDNAEVAAAADISARASAAYPLTSQAESLRDYVELRSLAASTQPGQPIDQQKMRTNVTLMAQARAALASSGYELGDSEAKALAQAIEGTGRTMDPAAQSKMLDAFVRAKQVYGNAISATSIRDYVMNAKASNFSASDESFFFTTFARLAQGNPSRLGNEFGQTMNTLVGGHMTKQGAEWLASLGLINKGQIKSGEGGKFYIEGGIKEHDLLSTDQTTWAQKVLFPALDKAGVTSGAAIKGRVAMLRKQDPNADEHVLEERAVHGLIADALMKSGFRQTVTDNLIHAIANELLTSKDVEQMKTALGLGAADTLNQNPVATFGEMTTALENFGSVLASPAMKDAASIMHSIAGGLSDLTASLQGWQKDHPMAAEAAGFAVPTGMAAIGGWLTWMGLGRVAQRFMGGGVGASGGAAAAGAIAKSSTTASILGWLGRSASMLGPMFALEAGLGETSTAERAQLSVADAATSRMRRQHGDDVLSAARKKYQPWWKKTFSLDAADADDAEYVRRYLDDLNDTRGSDVRERAGSPVTSPNPWGASGFELKAPTVDMQQQSAVVEDQARQLLASIQAIFAGGVEMPIRLDTSGVQAAARSAKASADAKVDSMLRSTYADLEVG